MEQPIVPAQTDGPSKSFKEFRSFSSPEQAKAHYHVVKERLKDINHWHRYATIPSAVFQLVDKDAKFKSGAPEPGDFVRIDLPGPGEPDGSGYDWVRVEHVGEAEANEEEQFALKLRPAPNPLEGNENDTAHFFSDAATSTFIVSVAKEKVTLEYHGRNEVLNKDGGFINKVRNAVTGIMAWLGLSDIQWKTLINGLIA